MMNINQIPGLRDFRYAIVAGSYDFYRYFPERKVGHRARKDKFSAIIPPRVLTAGQNESTSQTTPALLLFRHTIREI